VIDDLKERIQRIARDGDVVCELAFRTPGD
jgi:hypothetical protein